MDAETIKFPQEIISHYIDQLRKTIQVDAVLLFGSFAWGLPTKHSDVDLAIISPDFRDRNFDDRLDFLVKSRDQKSRRVPMDAIGYTPEEFENIEDQSAIMAQAKKKGRWLYKAQ